MPISQVFNIDCLQYMKTIPDKFFDLCIADPLYGLDKKSTHGRGKLKNRIINKDSIHDWDIAPSQEVFQEIFRVSKNQIIWGGNYFNLPPTRGIICWDKCQPWENFSQIEMAWTSFDYPAKLFRFDNRTTDKIHPTQKPINLYAWLLDTYAIGGGKIFDPFLGSGSSRIAAFKKDFDFYACELDKDYFLAQEQRFQEQCLGISLTPTGKQLTQLSLW